MPVIPFPDRVRGDVLTDVAFAIDAALPDVDLSPGGATREDAARLLREVASRGWNLIWAEDLLPTGPVHLLPLHGVEAVVFYGNGPEPESASQVIAEVSARAGRPVCVILAPGGPTTLQFLDEAQMREAGWVRRHAD